MPRVERQDAIVEAFEAALALGQDHRLEGAVAIARHRQFDRTVLGQHRLVRMPVAAVARAAAGRDAHLVAQVLGQFGAERALQKRFLQLLETGSIQPVFRATSERCVDDRSIGQLRGGCAGP